MELAQFTAIYVLCQVGEVVVTFTPWSRVERAGFGSLATVGLALGVLLAVPQF
ncbi:hypothetical protein [Couchioplanes caeruleus]|uniref:Uncharacterized protein n=1 Tax=Couchioplanes caeruleus TaxID=56438 RepID=A0A3N1GKY3_9ACTN|nr:hypothetical protein [Couchioplanes caeruleus]ROP30885.1 hypothetical protein EDD30_3757 [Couchioplanes caeruleus]